jgi:hypothetical protein
MGTTVSFEPFDPILPLAPTIGPEPASDPSDPSDPSNPSDPSDQVEMLVDHLVVLDCIGPLPALLINKMSLRWSETVFFDIDRPPDIALDLSKDDLERQTPFGGA